MYTAEFTYRKASSVAEAIQMLQQNPEAKLLAGGHSLIPAMKLRLAQPPMLIDISKVAELRGIRLEGDTLVIGAAATYYEIASHEQVKQAAPILADVIQHIGDPMVRHKGTIGGSLAHADPAADLPAAMLALEARMKIQGPGGSRMVDAGDFFQGMYTTALEPGEILTEIHIPANAGKQAYEKFPHPASRYPVVGVAVVVGANGLRAALTGAGERAVRLSKLEQALAGKPLTAEAIEAACQGIVSPQELMGDHLHSAEYRAHLVDVLAKRALMRLI